MECHDARMLLAFAYRDCEALDAAERQAFLQHLEKCPDCSAQAQADRHIDETIGQTMRDVPVPAGLKSKVLSRLAAQRPRLPWKQLAYAAAGLLLMITGGLGWYFYLPPELTDADVRSYAERGVGWNEDAVEQYFEENGLRVRVPRMFDYQFLRHIDIVEMKGRRVAKLTFSRNLQDRTATAAVLILAPTQFRMKDLDKVDTQFTAIRIRRNDDFTYVILCDENLDSLMRILN